MNTGEIVMPTYEYECRSCGHTFDAFQSIKDEPLKICPQCGREIRRLINGGTGVIFKGSGFYVTDKSKGAARPAGKTPGTEKPAAEKAASDKPAASGAAAPGGGASPVSAEKKAAGQ
jgi:putative FmdB family regulatory protein